MTTLDLPTKIRNTVITQMCYTKRHDYGLDKIDDDHFTSGMTADERFQLYKEMEQLYDIHLKPFVETLFKVTYVIPEKDKAEAIAKMLLEKYT